ncbi:MAG: hypothetical protein KIS95_04160 [Anaerolineae bacterium]|uniref:hypothetical protein n=1 Tax=Promineifilum sp. TaxID=2664178 RepID=UPI001E0B0046|nr:hypothetical protein [Anaerolineales bacterium]MCB8936039.1 hypothetical protein [Promineifilum sp.]MCO5181903.1 hypothetical protein [Promineifilum sp.]MCW5846400.1 hypothetical protein [Anaerolineae bacterium]
MTKKSNRPKAKSSAKTTAKATTNDVVTTEIASAPTTPQPRPSRAPKLSRSQIASERIEEEYAYITDDLRRVFVLAGAIFVLLIVLNIVLSRAGI